MQFASAVSFYFYTIVTNYNGSVAADIVCMNARHISKKAAKYRATTLPKLIIIRWLCTLEKAYPMLEFIYCLYTYAEEI